MRLPKAQTAIIDPGKIRDYILSLEHPVGRFKALFFGSLGFEREHWQKLSAELRGILDDHEAEIAETTRYGQKFIVRGMLVGPTGRCARIVTVWIVLREEEVPRFVTVYPER